MLNSTRSSYVLFAALFVISFESNAMLKGISSKVIGYNIKYHLQQMPRYFSTTPLKGTTVKPSYPFFDGLTEEHEKLLNNHIRSILREPENSMQFFGAFMWAAMKNNSDLMSEIVNAGFDINKHPDSVSPTALEYFLDEGDLEFAKRLLVEYKASPNVRSLLLSGNGDQPLWAKYFDNLPVLKLLIEHGLDTTQTDPWGTSCLTQILMRAFDGSKRAEEYIKAIDSFYSNKCKIHDNDKALIIMSSDFVEQHGWVRFLEDSGKTKWEPNEKEQLEKIFQHRQNQRKLEINCNARQQERE